MALLEMVSSVLIFSGAFFCLVGAIGVLRFPDVYARMHAAGITDTIGALLVVLGLLMLAGVSLAAVKLLFILAFLWMASPTATHALAKAARHGGVDPVLGAETRSTEGSSSNG